MSQISMKRVITSLIIFLVSLSAQAQNWQPVSRPKANGGTEFGWVDRKTATYPYTTVGDAAFYAAVNNGSLTLINTNPTLAPTGAKARLSLTNNLLYIETAGDVSQWKIERSDGTPLTGVIEGLQLQSGVFYNPGPNSNPPFDKQYRGNFTPALAGKSLKMTFKQSSGNTFVSTVTPAASSSGVMLFGTVTGSTSTTTTNPGSTTTNPGSSTNVSALAFQMAYNCSTGLLQYRFASPNTTDLVTVSLPGMTAGNQPKAPNVIYTNTYPSDALVGRSQRIIASQNGQTSIDYTFVTSCGLPNSLTGTSTNPGSTTTTPPPSYTYTPDDFPYTPLASTSVPAGDSLLTFQTGNLKAIVALGEQRPGTTGGRLSGSIWKLYNQNELDYSLIHYSHIGPDGDYSASGNNFRLGVGYGSGPFLYMNPRPHVFPSEFGFGQPDPVNWAIPYGAGKNPGLGDEFGLTPHLYQYGKRPDGTGYYLKQMMVHYNLFAVYARDMYLETWKDFSGHKVINHYKLTTNLTQTSGANSKQYLVRDDGQKESVLRDDGHEWDCLYVTSGSESSTGQRKDKLWSYVGNNPCSGASPFTVTIATNGGRPDVMRPTEPWVMVTGPGSSATAKGIGLILSSSRVDIKKLGSGGGERDRIAPNTNSVYINDNPKMLIDDQGVYYYKSTLFVGTPDEIRAEACDVSNRFADRPDDTFNKADRKFWRYSVYGDMPGGGVGKRAWDDGLGSIESRAFWRVYFSTSEWGSIDRSGVSWDAASINKICVKAAYTGNRTQWEAGWVQNGQLPNRAPATTGPYVAEEAQYFPKGQVPSDQKLSFNVIGDGVARVYEIPVGTHAKWKDKIMEFGIKVNPSGNNTQNTQADFYYIKGVSGSCPSN